MGYTDISEGSQTHDNCASVIISSMLICGYFVKVVVAINHYMTTFEEPDEDRDPEVNYETVVQYFDTEAKMWKPLQYVAQLGYDTQSCFCAEYFGNYLYVAGKDQSNQFLIYRYDVANNSWETLPPFLESNDKISCLCSVGDYLYAISESNLPQRYSLAKRNWQKGAKLPSAGGEVRSFFTSDDEGSYYRLSDVTAVVLKSKVYVIHACQKRGWIRGKPRRETWGIKPAVMHLTQQRMNGNKKRPPAVLILDPVFS